MEVFKTNDHDYSPYVELQGVGWSRNDLDSDKTTRTKDGRMRRDKITTKRKLTYKVFRMSQSLMAQLDDDLSRSTFTVDYLDLHGPQNREFYCSSFSATLISVKDGTGTWCDGAFTITEV